MTKNIQANIISKSFDPNTVLETRKMKFIISTGSKDRGREVINMDAWSFDNYKSNPIVGYQHAIHGNTFSDPNPDMVIGKSEVAVDLFSNKKVIVAEAEFEPADINPIADKILKKLVFGSLNAASVGILPVGNGRHEKGIYYYDGQELLEWSVVNIPMNQDAVKLSIDKALDAVRFVSDFLPEVNDTELKKMTVQQILDLIEGKGKSVTDELVDSLADEKADFYLNRLNQIKTNRKWTI